jgi:hypothetical protein
VALQRRRIGPGLGRHGCRPHGIEQLGADQEHHSGAGQRQQQAADAGIGLQVVNTAFDRAQRDRIGDQPRLSAGLDREQPGDLATHRHKLIKPRASRGVPPFPD